MLAGCLSDLCMLLLLWVFLKFFSAMVEFFSLKLSRSCGLTVGCSGGFVLAECVHPALHTDAPGCCCLPDVSFLQSLYLVLNCIHCGTGLHRQSAFKPKEMVLFKDKSEQGAGFPVETHPQES